MKTLKQCTLQDIIKWTNNGGEPKWASQAVTHNKYLQYKHSIRKTPVKTLEDIPLKIRGVLSLYKHIPNLVLTGSWFLGTYFDELDEQWVLDHRKSINKPIVSDIDFWSTESFSENKWKQMKDLQPKSWKVDLIKGWWGYGINLDTGKIIKCNYGK